MAYPTDRVQLFDRDMNPLPELAPSEVFSRVRHEEINGEHELVIVTTRRMEEGWRALTVDGSGRWREWVVVETPESHEDGGHAIGTYRLVWSLQYDLTNSYAHVNAVSIGLGADTTAAAAAAAILDGVSGWSVGNCDAAAIEDGTGCVLIYESSWSKLSKVIECSTAEADAEIEVSNIYGITARKLCLRAHIGSETATRRFDWGSDVTGIRRTPDPGPYFCRVVPLGKGDTEYADDDETTFEWPLDITEETGDPNLYYIEDADAALAFRRSDGNGGWIYPTLAVSYNEDDPELLLAAAMDDLYNHTRPNVTYEADVVQFARAGMDVQGVALGDDVQIVDRGFNPGSALRLQGRVTVIDIDELSIETDTELTIGNLRDNITDAMVKVDASLDDLVKQNDKTRDDLAHMTTARYIDELLTRINTEINATGGYAYFVPGEGIITYDVAVTDPLIGSEASQVVQIKGGSIRIANSKQTGFAGIDDWDWTSVFTADSINASLIRAVQITAGYIGDATGANYWNLDTGVARFSAEITVGGANNDDGVIRVLDANGNVICLFDNTGANIRGDIKLVTPGYQTNGTITTEMGTLSAVPTRWGWIPASHGTRALKGLHMYGTSENPDDELYLAIDSMTSNDANGTPHRATVFGASGKIEIIPNASSSGAYSYSEFAQDSIKMKVSDGTSYSSLAGAEINTDSLLFTVMGSGGASQGFEFSNGTTSWSGSSSAYNYSSTGWKLKSKTVTGSNQVESPNGNFQNVYATVGVTCEWLSVRGSGGSKSKVMDTDSFGDRMLYCYETPSPMFGDIGSGTVDEDGFAYVAIDPVFQETVRVDCRYQVFLQACGAGELWVEEKTPAYFVVRGTPGLSFDWEVKARQRGTDKYRLENYTALYSQHVNESKSTVVSDETAEAYKNAGKDSSEIADETASVYGDYFYELRQACIDALAG